tara:strand:- start:589 stop:1509 length:921 start_codon:yes stop_codon:yes gene_type:complete
MNSCRPAIAQDIINQCPLLNCIYTPQKKTTVFLPNYGEFGPTIDKLIKIVHFCQAPKKIICCKKGEEAFFPSATHFYYNWNHNLINDEHRWGLFTKSTYLNNNNIRVKNTKILHYLNECKQECQRIKKEIGDAQYMELSTFNNDKIWKKHSHLFRFELEPQIKQNIQADVIISPRKRESRRDNNFERWDRFIADMHKHKYTVGCIGSEEHSFKLENTVNSWDYQDNASASIELLNSCKVYVGLDTGPSHLASFMSIPMIVFQHNNPTDSSTWLMQKMTRNWFCDLGKCITGDLISQKALEKLNESF